ncbi:MAG TPA: hypothetical protein PLU73_08665 [Bacteroidia bacterium]|nr:hypothetical protein [Bacteroidia bacterium]
MKESVKIDPAVEGNLSFPMSGIFRTVIFVLLLSFFFVSCGKSEEEERQIHSLDSLSGALNTKLQELNQLDTSLLKKAIDKFENYRVFIKENVNDTLTKEEGDQLQKFYLCGKNLISFKENRSAMLARGSLINSQLKKLMLDLGNGSVEYEKTQVYFLQERKGAEELIRSCFGQQQAFQSALQDFRSSISNVESMIMKRNAGQLPKIIQETNSI